MNMRRRGTPLIDRYQTKKNAGLTPGISDLRRHEVGWSTDTFFTSQCSRTPFSPTMKLSTSA
jgi:hypothetical protein